MLNLARDVQSLSHFKRNTAAVMKRMYKTKAPVVLTVNGKAKAVVLDPATYQKMSAEAAKAEMIQFLKESRADFEAGRYRPALEVLDEIAEELGFRTAKKK
jgi:prevent-host-death family protein